MKKEAELSSDRRAMAVKVSLMMAIASQVTISLFTTGFQISAAVIVLVVMAFFQLKFPILLATIFAIPGIIVLRILLHILSTGDFSTLLAIYLPEAIFLLSYALLLDIYCRRKTLQPLRFVTFLPIIVIDLLANILEMYVRFKFDAFKPNILLQLAAIAVIRTAVIIVTLWAFHTYGLHILSREDVNRYRRLLLLVSELKDEMTLMKKSEELIEEVMGHAYSLCSDLRSDNDSRSETALLIAKDIHEVKKEYTMILRGIQEALKDYSYENGMRLQEIWDTIEPGIAILAKDMKKNVTLKFHCQDNLLTNYYYRFMSVFRNLIVNAIEAAGSAPVTIQLTQCQVGNTIRFQVSDNCGGIPQEYLNQIFQVGFSTKIDSETGNINRGLGLCMVKDIVELEWKGKLQVKSDHCSSCFTIDIPMNIFQEHQESGE